DELVQQEEKRVGTRRNSGLLRVCLPIFADRGADEHGNGRGGPLPPRRPAFCRHRSRGSWSAGGSDKPEGSFSKPPRDRSTDLLAASRRAGSRCLLRRGLRILSRLAPSPPQG